MHTSTDSIWTPPYNVTPDVHMDVTVIGGGVVGLAVAAHLSHHGRSVVVIERESKIGQHASSRNSGVIHAGIYYPKDSLKTKLCLRGKQLLYQFVHRHDIPFQACGKWIVSSTSGQDTLNRLYHHAQDIQVPMDWLSISQARQAQSNLSSNITHILSSPTTGILDTCEYMHRLQQLAEDAGTIICTQSPMKGISPWKNDSKGRYLIRIVPTAMEPWILATETVINCTGLWSDWVFRMAYLASHPELISNYIQNNKDETKFDPYSHPLGIRSWPARGHYYRLRRNSTYHHINRLIYPIPPNELGTTLGIHTTVDLSGLIRFGPSLHWDIINQNTDQNEYNNNIRDNYCPPELDSPEERDIRSQFHQSISHYLDNLPESDLYYDSMGIRPKISGPGIPARDFIITRADNWGLPNFINCIGVESPGLTGSLAIAERVAYLLGVNSTCPFI